MIYHLWVYIHMFKIPDVQQCVRFKAVIIQIIFPVVSEEYKICLCISYTLRITSLERDI
jgi:hypothetical protein